MTGAEDNGCATVPRVVEGNPPPKAWDAESTDWLIALQSTGAARDDAVARLHALLLRASRWQVQRLRSRLPDVAASEIDVLAQQAANDATVAVLGRLGDYEGRSRFTTWVFKFAILQASVTVRREAWRHKEIPTEPANWPFHPDRAPEPDQEAEAVAIARVLRTAIETALTPHQRDVLVALAINDVPVDVLADRLGRSRGALYKTLHDARARLRSALDDQGIDLPASPGKRTRP
jgi:RNA polymerase sigma-70 factor (ECF subfamily)